MLEHLIKKDDQIRVYSRRQTDENYLEEDASQIMKGKIFRIVSETELEAEVDNIIQELKKDVCYVLYMFSYEKVFLCEAYYRTEEYQSGKQVISFEILSPLERVQRRMHVRVSCRVSLAYSLISAEELNDMLSKEDSGEVTEQKKDTVYQETMIDLSAGGIRFTTGEKLHHKDYLYIEFEIPDKRESLKVSGYGEVIYADTFRGEEGLYDIRLKFIGMPEYMKEKIIHYVFYLEREYRKS